MRSGLFRLASTSAVVVTGLVALAAIAPAHAQQKPAATAKPAAAATAKPAAASTAKPAAASTAKPAAASTAKPAAASTAKPAAASTAAAKTDPKAKVDKTACATEPNTKLAEAKKKDEAKKAFKEGNARFDKADYEMSLTCFKLADAYVPGAKPKFKVAASLDKLGKVAEAAAAYDAYLAFVGPTPDDKFKEDVAEAKTRVQALKATPNKVKVTFTPADAPNAKIAVDGAPQAGPELTIPPGKHTITVTADGYDPGKIDVELGFAETREVPLTLNKTPEPVKTATPVATVAPTSTATAVAVATSTAPVGPPEKKSYVPAYVTLGLAGVGAVVGGIFGGMALSSKGQFDQTPTVELADETDRNALIADMSFAVALTFGVTGAVLLLSDSKPAEPAKTGLATKPTKKSAMSGFVVPFATPTGGGAAAKFTF
jgi:hypothetical protein